MRWATWRDIQAQPQIWKDLGNALDTDALHDWISSLQVAEVWFCGAGSSSFIGDIFVGGIEGRGGPWYRSIPSTDLISRPRKFLTGRRPLVVNLGRSGNSAESVGTLDALDALCPQAPWLNITCNPDGALASCKTGARQRIVVLPETATQAPLVSISAFSMMLMTVLALFDRPPDVHAMFEELSVDLTNLLPRFEQAAGAPPSRAVFLGTGPMAFAAREAAQKVMQLTGGKIPTMWGSPLGFRHGANAFVTDDTAITVFTSTDQHAAMYQADAVSELRRHYPNARINTAGPAGDIDVTMPYGDLWSTPLAVASAQVAGVVWGEALGVNIDDPLGGMNTLSHAGQDMPLYPVKPS